MFQLPTLGIEILPMFLSEVSTFSKREECDGGNSTVAWTLEGDWLRKLLIYQWFLDHFQSSQPPASSRAPHGVIILSILSSFFPIGDLDALGAQRVVRNADHCEDHRRERQRLVGIADQFYGSSTETEPQKNISASNPRKMNWECDIPHRAQIACLPNVVFQISGHWILRWKPRAEQALLEDVRCQV